MRRAEENQSAAGARRPEGIWDAYVRTRGVHVFCEAVRGRGVVRIALTKRPCGDWEVEVQDLNSYVLVFQQVDSLSAGRQNGPGHG